MRLNLHYILNSIRSAWKKRRGGPSFRQETLFNSFCKVISDGKIEKVEKSKISKWLNGGIQRFDEDLQKYANAARYNRKALAREIEKTIIPNIQTDKISALVDDWTDIIDKDNTIPAKDKKTFEALANSSVSQFLAEIVLYSFSNGCCSEVSANKRSEINHSGRNQGDDEEQASQRNNLLSSLRKKSCEKLSQQKRLLKYEIIPQLVSKPDIDLSEHDYNLLVAEGGAGKTSFLLDHWEQLLDSNATETKELPIYVPLNRFEGNDEFFIRNYIKKHYFSSQHDLEFDNWLNSAKDCNIILLLDAINEAKNSHELGAEIKELCALGCKIILTSRYDMEGWGSLENFKRVHLLPLSETIVDEQLKEQKLEVSERLRPFLTKPMYLALLLRVGEGTKGVESPGELFYAHHTWIKQTFSIDNHGIVYNDIGKTAFEDVLPQLATTVDSIRFKSAEVKPIIDRHFKDEGWDHREVLGLFVDAGILTKERQTYFFTHEHYLDFYRAYDMYSEMTDGGIPQTLGTGLVSSAVAAFLGDLFGEYRFEAKTDCSSEMSPIEAFMQQYLRNTGHQGSRIAIKNLVETMKISRNNHVTANYSGLDTSLCNFYDCSLPHSLFRGSTLSQNSFLSNGHTDYIDLLAYSPKHERLFTSVRHEKAVLVWNTSTGERADEMWFEKGVLDIDISLDERRFLVQTNNFIQVMNITDLSESHSIKCFDKEGNQQSIAFAKFLDSNRILCVTRDGYIKILRTSDGFEYTAIKIKDWANNASELYAMSQNRNILASVREAGNITIRKLDNLSEPIVICPQKKQDTLYISRIAICREDYVVIAGHNRLLAYSIPAPTAPPIIQEPLNPLWTSFVDTNAGIVCSGGVMSNCGCLEWDIANNKLTHIQDGFNDESSFLWVSGITASPDRNVVIAADSKRKIHFFDLAKKQNIHHLWAGFTPQHALTIPNEELTLVSGNYILRETWAGKIELLDTENEQVQRIDYAENTGIIKGTYLFVEDNNHCFYSVLDLCTGEQILHIPIGSFSQRTIVFKTKDNLILDNPGRLQIWSLSSDSPAVVIEGKGRWIEKNPENKSSFTPKRRNSFWDHVKQFTGPYDDFDSCNMLVAPVPERDVHIVIADLGVVVGGMLDGSVKVWNLTDGSCKMTIKVSSSAIIRISAIEGTRYAVIQTEDAGIYVIDLLAKECLLEYVGDYRQYIIDTLTNTQLPAWTDEHYIFDIAIFIGFFPMPHPENSTSLTIESRAPIISLNSSKGTLFVYLPERSNTAYSISSDRTKFALRKDSFRSGSCITVYDLLAKTEVVCTCDKSFSLASFAFNEAGNALVISSEAGDVYVINLKSKEIDLAWRTTNARDILMCDFSNAIIKGDHHFTDVLKLNGAITDTPLEKLTYDATGLFKFY